MRTLTLIRKRTLAIFIVFFMLALALAGCRQGGPHAEGSSATASEEEQGGNNAGGTRKLTLIYHFKSGSLDPANDFVALKAGITETLVRLDENLEVHPWLATQWEHRNPLTWVFTIRDGVTFQDGTKLDAAAVKASLQRAIAVNKSLGNSLKIVSMEANGQQLTVITKEPNPTLVSEFVNPYTSVVSVAAEKKMGSQAFNRAPVGTGPFQVKKFTPNVEILLERYDGYWDGDAQLDEVVFRFNEDGNVRALALQAKEADIATQIPAETVATVQKDDRLRVESVAGLRVHFLLFNPNREAMKDVKVRQAFDLLMDRESIADDVMLGHATPANGPFNTRLPFASREPVQMQNVEEAKKLLEEAGYTYGPDGRATKDGQPLTLELVTYKARPELPLIAQLLQSDAAKAGIGIRIQMVENIDTFLRENDNWDIATYSNLSAPRGDGGYFLNSALMPGGSLNAANIRSERLSEIISRLNATSDMNKRNEITQEAVAAIREEVPHVYLVYPNVIVGMNKRVTGWKPGAEEYYLVNNRMDVK